MVFSVINTSYVVCYTTTYATTWTVNVEVQIMCSLFIDCVHSSVRLVGSSPREGRVEICYHGIWSTVCIENFYFLNQFRNSEARVVCQQMGYSSRGN